MDEVEEIPETPAENPIDEALLESEATLGMNEVAAEHDSIHRILDMVDAYRAACLTRDYNETESALMAVQYHWCLRQSIDRRAETLELLVRKNMGLVGETGK